MTLSRDDLVGVWTLEATYAEDDDGNRTPALGDNPKGRIMYTDDGYMVAMTGYGGRQIPASGASDADKAAAFDSYMTYSGRWSVDGNVVTHVIDHATNPNWIGSSRERTVDHQGNRMVFSGISADGVTRAIIVWRRADA
ncbi:MAG: lipocalin-like domain-containing protein [Alphaproteobacteria bacterium]|nr:lipocalin-like domain-containing protein [Alphaproteobacteria bacterium]